MSDSARMIAARQFFWETMDRIDLVVDVETAQRQIKKLAEALPPFTRISDAQL